MKVIVTEKPSVARTFAKVLGARNQNKGYYEGNGFVISWCLGHLVEMSYPEKYDISLKNWSLDPLPFVPAKYKYQVIEQAEVKKQFQIIQRLYNSSNTEIIYYAPDPAREGIYIASLVRMLSGVRPGVEERVVWIDSQTEEEIIRGIEQAKPLREYQPLIESGFARAKGDYLVGINFTRALSLRYGHDIGKAVFHKPVVVAVGRVMSCTLGIVTKREREILNFKSTPFFRVIANFCGISAEWRAVLPSRFKDSPLLYKENGFLEESKAKEFSQSFFGKPLVIGRVERKNVRKQAPTLFNIEELQNECSKTLKLSPSETLAVAQSLYEKKLTTYPRTSARVLSEAIAKVIEANIKGLTELTDYEEIKESAEAILEKRAHIGIEKTSYVNDKKIEDHYAIIPTGYTRNIENLTSIEKSVYCMIAKRFLSIFYEPAIFENITLQAYCGEEPFFTQTHVLKEKGYLELMGIEKDIQKEAFAQKLLSMQEGMSFSNVDFHIEKGKTSPPKRYTSGSLILAMENAGKLIEEEELRNQIKGSGIGTSATRADTISKLISIGTLSLDKKTQIIRPTNFGNIVFDLLCMVLPSLLSPKMTASWETGLSQIAAGTISEAVYMSKFNEYVKREVRKIKEADIKQALDSSIATFQLEDEFEIKRPCPRCCGTLMINKVGDISCSNYKADKSGCNFYLSTKPFHKQLSKKQILSLLDGNTLKNVKGLKKKDGTTFQASLMYKEEKIVIAPYEIEYLNTPCPICKKRIIVNDYYAFCEGHNQEDPSSCSFHINRVLCKKKISNDQLEKLIKYRWSDLIYGFKSKDNKNFKAKLKLLCDEHNFYNLAFDFGKKNTTLSKNTALQGNAKYAPNNTAIDSKYTCPKCGAILKKAQKEYVCAVCHYNLPTCFEGLILSDDLIESLLHKEITKWVYLTIKGRQKAVKLKLDNTGTIVIV